MKILCVFILLTVTSQIAFGKSKQQEYDPYLMDCVYQASPATRVVTDIDADMAYFGVTMEDVDGDQKGRKEEMEFKEVFVLYPGEDKEVDAVAQKLAKALKVNFSDIFTITQFILFDGTDSALEWSFYKLNSENGALGFGLDSNQNGGVVTICK